MPRRGRSPCTTTASGCAVTRSSQNIGTIARSGTGEFLASLRERPGQAVTPELIGQFGVGFYSSFMVADRITLLTRRAGEATATRWESAGDGYTLEAAERDGAGTSVTLHLKPVDAEDGLADFTQAGALRETVKKYSDFVAYPIRLGADTLNSMKAIWARGKDEVTEEEYREFYKHITRDWNDPLEHLAVHIEGAFEARALLYIPSKAPFDLWHDGARGGVQLYVQARVHHGRLQGALAAVAPLRPRRGGLRRPVAERVAGDPAAEPPDPGDSPSPRPPAARRPRGDEGRAAGALPDVLGGVRFRVEGGAPRVRGKPGADPRAVAGSVDRRFAGADIARRLRRPDEGGTAGDLLHDRPVARRHRALAPPRGLPRQGLRGALLHRSRRRALAAAALASSRASRSSRRRRAMSRRPRRRSRSSPRKSGARRRRASRTSC